MQVKRIQWDFDAWEDYCQWQQTNDYSEILDECSITQEKDFDSIVVEIYSKVIIG